MKAKINLDIRRQVKNLDPYAVGKRIKQALEPMNWGCHEMADRCDCSYDAIRCYIVGGKLPGANFIYKFCNATGCSADWLLGINSNNKEA